MVSRKLKSPSPWSLPKFKWNDHPHDLVRSLLTIPMDSLVKAPSALPRMERDDYPQSFVMERKWPLPNSPGFYNRIDTNPNPRGGAHYTLRAPCAMAGHLSAFLSEMPLPVRHRQAATTARRHLSPSCRIPKLGNEQLAENKICISFIDD